MLEEGIISQRARHLKEGIRSSRHEHGTSTSGKGINYPKAKFKRESRGRNKLPQDQEYHEKEINSSRDNGKVRTLEEGISSIKDNGKISISRNKSAPLRSKI